MRRLITIAKALSDVNRVRALMLLQAGELCLCQIIDLLELAPSTVSKHMAVLLQAGLVESRKDGRWHYYRLPEKDADRLVRQSLDWVGGALEGCPELRADRKRLKAIMKKDKDQLCECYKN